MCNDTSLSHQYRFPISSRFHLLTPGVTDAIYFAPAITLSPSIRAIRSSAEKNAQRNAQRARFFLDLPLWPDRGLTLASGRFLRDIRYSTLLNLITVIIGRLIAGPLAAAACRLT